jgi:hypothetical protein
MSKRNDSNRIMLDEEASNFATPTRSVMQPRKKLF